MVCRLPLSPSVQRNVHCGKFKSELINSSINMLRLKNKNISLDSSLIQLFTSSFSSAPNRYDTVHEISCDGGDSGKYCHRQRRKTPSTNVTKKRKLSVHAVIKA